MKEVTLHSQTKQEGDFVCLAYGSGNRDEWQYPNPAVVPQYRRVADQLPWMPSSTFRCTLVLELATF